MNPVTIPPLKDYVVESLRHGIFDGRLSDGEELTQEGVASQLGISRIPVREAFLQLETEGLLIRMPNRHVKVVGISANRLWQSFHVLAAIESEIALQLLGDGNAAVLTEAIARCREAYQRREWSLLREADRMFHLSISEALNYHTLHQLHRIQYRVLFGGIVEQIALDWEKVMALDEAIWRAVRGKDETSVRSCIYEYYTALAQDAVKELKL